MNLDLQPTLIGERVIVRPVEESDWDAMYQAASDLKIWELHPVSDRYTAPVFREFFDGAIASKAAFAIVDRSTQRMIGSSRYHGYDPGLGEIEIGWTFLAPDYWGGSYNREIKKLMLDHAFQFVDTVIFVVGEKNFRSQRAVEKIGGIMREGSILRALNGVEYKHVVFEIRKDALSRLSK